MVICNWILEGNRRQSSSDRAQSSSLCHSCLHECAASWSLSRPFSCNTVEKDSCFIQKITLYVLHVSCAQFNLSFLLLTFKVFFYYLLTNHRLEYSVKMDTSTASERVLALI